MAGVVTGIQGFGLAYKMTRERWCLENECISRNAFNECIIYAGAMPELKD